jgi:hypothetical protein
MYLTLSLRYSPDFCYTSEDYTLFLVVLFMKVLHFRAERENEAQKT